MGAYRPSRSHVQVAINPEDAIYFPRVCIQCDDAPCIDDCPTDALVRDSATNAVVVVEEECTECGVCEEACPYGVIRCMDGKAQKCELCDGDPECVRFCVPGALRYEPHDRWSETERQAYTDRLRMMKEAKA